jgi:AraC-like DNA-binding protein
MDEALYNFPSTFFSHIADFPVYNLTDNDEYSNRMEYLKILASKLADHDNICRYEIMLAMLRSMFMEILNRIVRNFRINTSEPKHRRRLLDEFVNTVSANPDKREVAYFAERLCITPKYLSAIVADGTSFTAKEFIDRSAISTIKQLLRTTDLSVKQIAEQLNFSGSGNLCRFFKTNTGITISDFKRELKG